MPHSLPLVQLQLILPFLSALRKRGIDPEVVLESVGLTRLAVEQPGATVHVMVVHEFLESCAKATKDITFCAQVGARLDTQGWPVIQQAMAEARTLGEFLSIYVTKASQVASSVTAYLDIRGDTAMFGESRRFKPLIPPAQNDGFMACLMLSLIEHSLGDGIEKNKVTIVVCDPGVLPTSARNFQILRGDDMGARVQFPSEWLRVPVPVQTSLKEQSYPKTLNTKDADFLTSFRSILRQQVALGGISSMEAARRLHMNPRTLARYLSAFDTTASKEISIAKMQYAKQALETSDRSIEEISLDLGYSDASNFARAFAKSTGEKPSAYRAKKTGHL